MAVVGDVHADVVQQRRVFQPFALAIGQRVHAARLVEEAERRGAPRGSRDRASSCTARPARRCCAGGRRVAIGLGDLLAVLRDVIEDRPSRSDEVAERDLVRAEPLQDRVEQHRAGRREVGAPRVEPGDAQALLERQRGQLLAHAAQLFRGDAAIAQRRVGVAGLGGRGHGAEAGDRAGGADHAIEPRLRDAGEILAGLRVDPLDDLARVARRQRIGLDVALGQADDADLEALAALERRTRAARDLDAAAADVDDDRDVAGHVDAVAAPPGE